MLNKQQRNVVIIQARIKSTRLPGKVLKKVLGKPILLHLVDRLRTSKLADEIIVATTTKKPDDSIEKICIENDVSFFRGSDSNVLSRYYKAAKKYNAKTVVRICSDSPLIDSDLVDELIYEFSESQNCDYLSNTIDQTYPIGMNIEVFTFDALKKAYLNGVMQYEREHVTPYIYLNKDVFSICQKHLPKNYSNIRITLDEEKDFLLIKSVIEHFSKQLNFKLDDIINLYNQDKELFNINADVVQKKFKPD